MKGRSKTYLLWITSCSYSLSTSSSFSLPAVPVVPMVDPEAPVLGLAQQCAPQSTITRRSTSFTTCCSAVVASSQHDGEPSNPETLDPTSSTSPLTTAVGDEPSSSSESNDNCAPTQQQQQQHHRHDDKLPSPKHRREEWKALLDEFQRQVLHPSYQPPPIRANTVHSAAEYAMLKPTQHLMPGTHKHLGGAYDPSDGGIYGVPAHSAALLCLRWEEDEKNEEAECGGAKDSRGFYRVTCLPLPERVAGQRFKWLRGIFANGYLWAIPSWADSVLCVDVDALWKRRELPPGRDIVTLLPLPARHQLTTWQWHGAGINPDRTAIYCIPSNARHVLKVDLVTQTTSLIDIQYDPSRYPDFSLDQTNKWYGGIPGTADACVYGIPYRSCAVLQIDTRTDSARLIGPNYGVGCYNWHGGLNLGGTIYAHPSHARTVLAVRTLDPNPDRAIVEELPIAFNTDGTSAADPDARPNYKWLGGVVGADGNIYCPACDTSAVLKIDPRTDKCETFGDAGPTKNKWQGGVLSPRDSCIYCIPASGRQVLRIATSTNPPALQLLGDLPAHKDKWQGGHVGRDGNLYFIPENGYRVLKVTPAASPPLLVNGTLVDDGVKLEYL